jgi:hypothetical protein
MTGRSRARIGREVAPGSASTCVPQTISQSRFRYGVAVACGLIEALLIAGFVVASLGIGYEDGSHNGPDRPPAPQPERSEPRPEPGVAAILR